VGNQAISFVKLDRLAGPKPLPQLAGVSKLPKTNLGGRLRGHVTSPCQPILSLTHSKEYETRGLMHTKTGQNRREAKIVLSFLTFLYAGSL
jgi:hypothetical protein